MAYQIPPFLKRDKDSLLFNQDGELIYYIPEDYFTIKAAELNKEYVELFGLFYYSIFDSKGKSSGLKIFKFPTVFLCKPYEIEKVKGLSLTKTSEPSDYRLLKFKKNDQVVSCVYCIQSVSYTELFFKLFDTAKIPNINYEDLYKYFNQSLNINGADFGLNAQMYGIVVSELCRDSRNKQKLFRHTDMKDMTDYQFISIKDIPNNVSPYTAISSENWDESISAALSIKNAKDSPMEKLMMT